MRSQVWWLALLLGCSLSGAAHASSLDQQVFQLQLVMDQIHLARSLGDRVGVCVESRRANNLVLDLLPALNCTVLASITLPCKTGSCWDLISVDRAFDRSTLIDLGSAV